MRTAEEIMSENFLYPRGQREAMIKVINEARKEAIEECAESAVVFMPSHPHIHGTKNIDKQSILNLINELK